MCASNRRVLNGYCCHEPRKVTGSSKGAQGASSANQWGGLWSKKSARWGETVYTNLEPFCCACLALATPQPYYYICFLQLLGSFFRLKTSAIVKGLMVCFLKRLPWSWPRPGELNFVSNEYKQWTRHSGNTSSPMCAGLTDNNALSLMSVHINFFLQLLSIISHNNVV